MKKQKLFFILLMAVLTFVSAKTNDHTLYQQPTANKSHIVFVYAGDLWKVPISGGEAHRLTHGIGTETNPVFSPNGKYIAFTGQYDGNADVFIIPAAGGVPTRLTYHPTVDRVVSWTRDSKKVLFSSSRSSVARYPRLYTMGIGDGLPKPLPLPMGERGTFSPDGNYIAYEPLKQWQPDWKRYKGGQQDVIWIASLKDSSIKKIPGAGVSSKYPMWMGDKIYFLSDRNSPSGRVSLFSFDPKTAQISQLIDDRGLDIKSATAGHNAIVYEQFGTIHVYDIAKKQSRKIHINVNADMVYVREKFINAGSQIRNAAISPSGARAVFEAHGEIISLPAKKGDPRNLTRTPGVMERDPSWSPDGKWIAYFSDESGEYDLHLVSQDGRKKKKFSLPPAFYYSPKWSPDSSKIAFTDNMVQLWYIDIKKEGSKPVKVDKNPIGILDNVLDTDWSPDSQWLTYARQKKNLLRAIYLYSLKTGKNHQVTDSMSDARYPKFNTKGTLLYFTASTDIGPLISFADMSSIGHQTSRSVYAVVLSKKSSSPLSFESDEEKISLDKPKNKESKTPEDKKKPKDKKKKNTRIDLKELSLRIIYLPIARKNWVALAAGHSDNLYLTEFLPAGPGTTHSRSSSQLHKFDMKKRKLSKIKDKISSFSISADGKKVLYSSMKKWVICKVLEIKKPGGANTLKTSSIKIKVNPKAEWKQMFHEVWRGERDFFYDPNLHGMDIIKMERLYSKYLGSVQHRSDLNYLFTEMVNQLTIGHMWASGGDTPNASRLPGGLLGCDFTIEKGHYRIKKIYRGEHWNPRLVAPLAQPGLKVKEGDYLFAVNEKSVSISSPLFKHFENTAGHQVTLRVGSTADVKTSHEIKVVPIRSEGKLRHLEWIDSNRKKVARLSNGKLAYIYMPNTSNEGFVNFNRYFFSQTDKQGALLDERFNGGGLLADYVVQLFTRKPLGMIVYRHGSQDVPVPAGLINGPKAMLINQLAGSGGDAMPWFFKKAGVGPLIGKKTWGGLVASFRLPRLMDGGSVNAPDAAIYGLSGNWEVENIGVAPDYEIDFDPYQWRKGRDIQLEKGVALLLKELKNNPQKTYKRPPYPKYNMEY